MTTKRPSLLPLALLVLSAFAPLAGAANLIVDPGFENPGTLTFDGPPFLGTWEGFSGSPSASASTTGTMPRSGSMALQLSITLAPNTFAGAFQDATVAAGAEYTFSGYNATSTTPLQLGPEVRIEWRSASAEVGRTPNLVPTPGLLGYTPFSLTATAPAGATIARLVYAVQTFSTNPLGNGVVFVDDLSFSPTAVPEPGTAALGALAGLALLRRRRRVQ